MRLHIAYNQNGRILAAAEPDADAPAPGPGVTVAELDVPAEFKNAKPVEYLHLLREDVAKKQLTR